MLNLFGKKSPMAQNLVSELLSEILEKGGFSLSFQMEQKEKELRVDIFGEDEGLLKTRRGKLLSALQTYLKQALYKEFPDEKIKLYLDSNGYWKEQEEKLLSLADRLIKKALDSNHPVSFRQLLSPNQRRLIHEKVAGNTGVRSQSFGSGAYKTLKLIPDTFRSQ